MGNQQLDNSTENKAPPDFNLIKPTSSPSSLQENTNTDARADSHFSDFSKQSQVTDNTSVFRQSETNSQTTSTLEKEEVYIATLFWKDEGNSIYINGDFFNWKEYKPLKEDKATKLKYIKLILTKKKYYFNFKVDGVIKHNKDYQSENVNGAINNFIEITEEKIRNQKITEEKIKKAKIIMAKKQEEERKKQEYNNYYPKNLSEFRGAPNIPFHYSHKFNVDVNSRQNLIGQHSCLEYKEKNLLSENNSFKKILSCPHINL